jgi:hypothetical protein
LVLGEPGKQHGVPSVARMLPQFGYFCGTHCWSVSTIGGLMKLFSSVLTIALLVAGCSQVIDQFYSKRNFDTQSFNADISECKERNASLVAMHVDAVEPDNQVDDATVRECMKAKGYMIQLETN